MQGYTGVVDADLSKYFDTIPHQEMLQCVARRVTDRHVPHLVKIWLKAPPGPELETRVSAGAVRQGAAIDAKGPPGPLSACSGSRESGTRRRR